MTNARGSSLAQAPSDHHNHHHSHHHHMHLHRHLARERHPDPSSQPDDEGGSLEVRQPQSYQSSADVDSIVTEVVQTISVIQYVDASGSVVEVSTAWSPPVTQIINQSTGATISVLPELKSGAESPSPSLPVPQPSAVPLPDATSTAPLSVSSSSSTELPPLSTDLSSSPDTSSSIGFVGSTNPGGPIDTATGLSQSLSTSTQQILSVTATPSTTTPVPFPSLPRVYNSSSSASLLFTNSTQPHTLFSNSTTSSHSSTSSDSTSIRTTITSSSSLSTSTSSWSTFSTDSPAASNGVFGNPDASATAGGIASPTETSESSSSPGSMSPETSRVVGGVVGGVAALAIFLAILLFALRWKRRKSGNALRLSDGTGTRALPSTGGFLSPPGTAGSDHSSGEEGGGGGGGGGGGRGGGSGSGLGMTQRPFPFAIPATLAALSGYKHSSQAASGSETGERSFERVAGRKLPSILQHGGNGYDDPHDSVTSGGASVYRDSRSTFGGLSGRPRYALAAPMRPDSGIPVYQPGPARVPVHTPPSQPGPRFESMRQLTPPGPLSVSDAVGRSLRSQDGSRGSGSRFTEEI